MGFILLSSTLVFAAVLLACQSGPFVWDEVTRRYVADLTPKLDSLSLDRTELLELFANLGHVAGGGVRDRGVRVWNAARGDRGRVSGVRRAADHSGPDDPPPPGAAPRSNGGGDDRAGEHLAGRPVACPGTRNGRQGNARAARQPKFAASSTNTNMAGRSPRRCGPPRTGSTSTASRCLPPRSS